MQRSSSLSLPWVLLLVLLWTVPQTSMAQLHHLETILESDGLPSPDIKSITQDRWGLIWIATRGGIACHNGLTWERVDLDSLTSSTAEGLLEIDQEGDVWALLSGNEPALLRHNFCNWESASLPPGFDKQFTEFTHFALAADDERTVAAIAQLPNLLHVSTADGWQQVPLEQNGISLITDLTAMDGNFILASSQGVFSISASDPLSIHPLLNPQPPNLVRSLCLNRLDNSLWMVGNNWIGKVVQGEFEFVLQPQDDAFICFTDPHTRTCQTDAYGGIYLSGIFSTQYFHPQTGMETRGPKNGFMEFGTTDFFLDRENVLWQGTAQGIHKILSRHTTGYNRQQGLLADEVTALLRRRDGTLVVGHNNGMTLWNGQMTHLVFPENDLRDRVLDLAEDSRGNVWIAGRQRGVGRLSPDGSLRWWPLNERISNYTSSVLVDDRDRIWIAASDKLLIMDNGELTEYPLLSHVEKGVYLRRLIKGRDGTVYVATGNRGLLAIKGEEFRQWRTGLRNHGDSVYDVLEMPDGAILVGTRNGLYQLDGDRLVRPAQSNLKVNRPVYFLEIDQKNRLWMGTDNGVIRVDEDQVTYLTAEDGLIGRETNRCANHLDSDGKFWVGTERGLTVFNDLFENTNPLPPLVYLVELEVAGKTYPLHPGSSDITLPAQTANLVFHYRIFTTTEFKRLNILSQLDGVDNDWVQHHSPGQQIIRYTNVPPGAFQFHVKAAGFGQPWSNVISSPAIMIPAPIWQRTWFMMVAGLALLAMLALPIIFIAQRRYTIRLKNEVAEQVAANLRIEAELEQARNLKALGLLAGGIAHDFNNLLTIIFGNLSLFQTDDNLDSLQLKRLSSATGAIERARGLTNQLLTFSRGGAPILEVGSLAQLVRESADFVLRGSSTKCRFELPDDLWSVVMDSGQMSQVVNNLLMNAQEAMPSGGVIILAGRNLDQGPAGLSAGIYVEITVSDNGPGIYPEDLPKIFDPYFSTKENGSGLGLATAYSILERHDGRLTVETTLGKGTTFKLLIPASSDAPDQEPHRALESSVPLDGTVLLLDDDLDVRQSMGLMLKSLGFQVEYAEEGSLALDLYRKMLNQGHPPEIVLMDLTIPGGLGGQEIIAPLLEMDPKAKAIVISGYSHNPVISEYRNHGFKAAIAKPIMVHELGKVLRKVLSD
jgi:signal transduction histidine kinase/ligand-binding sensor domain-containing protein/CheY-like chemotaxis protein